MFSGMDVNPLQPGTSPSHSAAAPMLSCLLGLQAAHNATISSRILQTGWLRQAVKCHYTRVIDSEDQFRLPL